MLHIKAVAFCSHRKADMASVTIRDLPERTVLALKKRASRNHRSLNGEILSLFAYVVSFDEGFDFPLQPPALSEGERQKETILGLSGMWKDSRPIHATIAGINRERTAGRGVPL